MIGFDSPLDLSKFISEIERSEGNRLKRNAFVFNAFSRNEGSDLFYTFIYFFDFCQKLNINFMRFFNLSQYLFISLIFFILYVINYIKFVVSSSFDKVSKIK